MELGKKVLPVAGVKVVRAQREHLPLAGGNLIYISVIFSVQVVVMAKLKTK